MKEPLSKRARRFYSFGPFRLYVAERELFRGTEPVPLTPKATDTLFELIGRRGHVVEKDDLLKALWPDTFVEEANLGQQISHLRRTLGDGPDGKPYIETIPKRGYRFTARVTESWEELETAGGLALIEDGAPALPVRKHTWRLLLSGTVVALVVGGLLWFYFVRKAGPLSSGMEIRPLTSYPGNEAWPSFSPDGNQVAFAWKREDREDFDIYVKVIGSDKPLQLTNTPDWDISPAWSPDGQEIAFERSRPDGWHAIYVVSPLGGPERLVTELEGRGYAFLWPNPNYPPPLLSWSPDGRWLAYGGIEILSVATGEKRRLTPPPSGWLCEGYPAFSPDGQSVAFVRRKASYVDDIYVASAARGEPRRLTSVGRTIWGLCWTPDGREIVFSSSQTPMAEADLWRVPVSGGAPRPLTEVGEHAWFPTISRHGRRLAFTRQLTDLNIWRMETPGIHGIAKRAVKLIASTKTETAPQFSPDGKRIAFTSDRSGTSQVWVCDRDGSNPFQLTSFPAPGAELSAWSPDGKHIAFNSLVSGNWDIYVVPVQGGVPRRLTAENSDDSGPSWSRDGRWVYFGSDRTGRHEVWKAPVAGGPAMLVTRSGGYKPVESPDGKFIYYNKGYSVFDAWKTPAEGGQETPVLENLRSRWALAESGLYLFDQEPDGRWFLKFFDFATRRKNPVAAIPGTPVAVQRPDVSPDGRTFLYTQWDLGEADLVLVENFR